MDAVSLFLLPCPDPEMLLSFMYAVPIAIAFVMVEMLRKKP